jgi:hypothetical protein
VAVRVLTGMFNIDHNTNRSTPHRLLLASDDSASVFSPKKAWAFLVRNDNKVDSLRRCIQRPRHNTVLQALTGKPCRYRSNSPSCSISWWWIPRVKSPQLETTLQPGEADRISSKHKSLQGSGSPTSLLAYAANEGDPLHAERDLLRLAILSS